MINNFPKVSNLKYADIKIDATYSFSRKISKEDVLDFAKLTGDFNPIHVNPQFGKKSIFKNNIVHGMFIGSLFSTLVGMNCPGKNCLYLSQDLEFIKPVFFDQQVIVKGTVKSKIDAFKMILIVTEILVDGKTVTRGLAKVKVLE